jgi:hypothetical protein
MDQHKSNDLGDVLHIHGLHRRLFSLKTIGSATGVSAGEFPYRTPRERVVKVDGILGRVISGG